MRHKVIKYFLLISGLAAIILIAFFAFGNVRNIIVNSESIEQSSVFLRNLNKLEINLLEIRSAGRSYAHTSDTLYKNEYFKHKQSLDNDLNELLNNRHYYTAEFTEIKNLLETIYKNSERSFTADKNDSGWREIQNTISRDNELNYQIIKNKLSDIGDRELNIIGARFTASKEYYENASYTITSGSIFTILFFYLLMYLYFKRYEKQREETERTNKELLAVNKELTLLKEDLEQRVEMRTQQLKRVNEELDSYNHSVAHELINPLSAINSLSLSVIEKENLHQQVNEKIRVIYNSSKHLIEIIGELLQFSTVTMILPEEEEKVDMNSLADSILNNFANSERKIQFLIKESLPPVKGNQLLLKQVLDNYINNAVKFTSKNEAPVVEIGHIPDESEYIYYVKDNGIGFDMKYYEKMFNVFQRFHTDKEFKGNGIGLSLSKRIIHKHGGRVWAEGKPGEGAVFYFSLPKS